MLQGPTSPKPTPPVPAPSSPVLRGRLGLSVLAGALAFGGTGAALALAGAGIPFLVACAIPAVAAGLVQFAAFGILPPPDRTAELAAVATLDAYRGHTAALRHDLRGVLSPALMMSDRLLRHDDPTVQRAGQAVVRSVERATALLSSHKDALAAEAPAVAPVPPPA